MLQGSIDSAIKEPLYTETARILSRDGFLGIVVDAPAHGVDARPQEPAEIAAWNERVGRGEDLLGEFLARVRAVVDSLAKRGEIDVSRLAVAGTSRGGFLAFHVAAADPRFRCVGAISPVTDLMQLREFHDCIRPEKARALSVTELAPRLAGRPVWLSIGNSDDRVGTDAAIAAARRLVAESLAQGRGAPVDLTVHSVPGHRSSLRDHELLAAWILKQMASASAPAS
jgi:dienelactone hydrolase